MNQQDKDQRKIYSSHTFTNILYIRTDVLVNELVVWAVCSIAANFLEAACGRLRVIWVYYKRLSLSLSSIQTTGTYLAAKTGQTRAESAQDKPRRTELTQDRPRRTELTQDRPRRTELTQDRPRTSFDFVVPDLTSAVRSSSFSFDMKYLSLSVTFAILVCSFAQVIFIFNNHKCLI